MSGFIILSYGRSGSVLLAHNVGRSVGSLPTYANYPHELGSRVVHTHLKLPGDSFSGYQRIFNLRSDPVETVLSFCMAKHYNEYHRFKDQDLMSFEPFNLDSDSINNCCHGLIDWHDYYSTQLHNNDLVVVYEQMIQVMTTGIYDRIYPDKQRLILNYDQAQIACREHLEHMLASMQKFLQHTNQQDISGLLNYTN